MNGSNARKGDLVRNLTTGEIGTVLASCQDGRLIVSDSGKWERWNVEVLGTQLAFEAIMDDYCNLEHLKQRNYI